MLLGPLAASAVSDRAHVSAELAEALFRGGRAREADPFAERAFLFSAFSEHFLPLYVKIQQALGRPEHVRAAYRRAGVRLAAAGKVAEAIALFNRSHYAYEQSGLGDRYEFDFEIMQAIDALVDYTHYHFAAEEALMERYDYPVLQAHRQKHGQLAKQVKNYAENIHAGNLPGSSEFQKFFSGWIITHILNEDRKIGEFLNSKDVF